MRRLARSVEVAIAIALAAGLLVIGWPSNLGGGAASPTPPPGQACAAWAELRSGVVELTTRSLVGISQGSYLDRVGDLALQFRRLPEDCVDRLAHAAMAAHLRVAELWGFNNVALDDNDRRHRWSVIADALGLIRPYPGGPPDPSIIPIAW